MRHFALILVVGLAACSAPQPTDDSPPVETTPEEKVEPEVEAEEPVSEPSSAPASATASTTGEMPAADTAQGVAARIAEAHGAQAFGEAAEIEFDFIVVNAKQEVFKASHRWDLKNQRARVEWKNKADEKMLAVVSLSDPTQGWVTIGDEFVTGSEKSELLQAAYSRWVNDAYWLAMPLKLTDPGVNLELVEDRKVDGKSFKVLKVTYGDVGLTPGDTYWVYADPETHVVGRWDMLLQGAEKGAEPTAVSWQSPVTTGGVTLHSDHPVVGTPRNIRTPLKAVHDSVDEAAYAEPTE